MDFNALAILNEQLSNAQAIAQKGDFEQAMSMCEQIKKECEPWRDTYAEFEDLYYRNMELTAQIHLENNDVVAADLLFNSLVSRFRDAFKQNGTLDNLVIYCNVLLNQVILWDKMKEDNVMGVVMMLGKEDYDYKAKQQLYDAYMLCYNFEGKSPQKGRLMRRLRQTLEIVKDKGLGYIASPQTMKLVKHFRKITVEASQLEREGRHEECVHKFQLLVKSLKNLHYVDIYFEPDWYASLLFMLGKDARQNNLKELCNEYYAEALQIRCELDDAEIPQNDEDFANLLYENALQRLSSPVTQESIRQSLNLLLHSNEKFETLSNKLNTQSMANFASCSFNLGQIICMFTDRGKQSGLPYIQKAIDIQRLLVSEYGGSYINDLTTFQNQYEAIKNA